MASKCDQAQEKESNKKELENNGKQDEARLQGNNGKRKGQQPKDEDAQPKDTKRERQKRQAVGLCLGSLFPEIWNQSAMADPTLSMHTLEPIRVTLKPQGSTLNATVNVQLALDKTKVVEGHVIDE